MHLFITLLDLSLFAASLGLFAMAWRSQGPKILPIATAALAAGATQLIVWVLHSPI